MAGVIEEVARAIEEAQCNGREGPYGQYDFSQYIAYGTARAPYRIRDMRDPSSPDYCRFIAEFDDHDECSAEFKRLTDEHIAIAAIRTLLSGPVGDVLQAAIVAYAEPTRSSQVLLRDTLEALPSEITDMLGGE